MLTPSSNSSLSPHLSPPSLLLKKDAYSPSTTITKTHSSEKWAFQKPVVCTSVIPALGRLKQEDLKFRISPRHMASTGPARLHSETLFQKQTTNKELQNYNQC
jgi:hypothetical protein